MSAPCCVININKIIIPGCPIGYTAAVGLFGVVAGSIVIGFGAAAVVGEKEKKKEKKKKDKYKNTRHILWHNTYANIEHPLTPQTQNTK